MTDENKPYTTKPTSQLDLERRAAAGFATVTPAKVDPNAVDAPYAVEDNDTSAYRGVDADRMTYASDTEKPLNGDGVEDKVAKQQLSGYAYGEKLQAQGQQTLGSGSSEPSAVVVTSGEEVSHHVTDTGKLATDAKKAEDKGEAVKAPPMPSGSAPKGKANKGAASSANQSPQAPSEGNPSTPSQTPSTPPTPPSA